MSGTRLTDALAGVPPAPLAEAVIPLASLVPGVQRLASRALTFAQDLLQCCCGDEPYGLTIDEVAALNLYTKYNFRNPQQSFYAVLTWTLSSPQALSPPADQLSPFLPYLRLFFAAARKLPNACPARLWRGMAEGPNGVAAAYEKGKLIHWWGVTSTTYDADMLRSPHFFGSSGNWSLFALECHSGVDISRYSDYDEAEVLLIPPTKLLVEQVMPGDVMGGVTLVLLKQIKEEEEEEAEGDDRGCGEEEAEEEEEEDAEEEEHAATGNSVSDEQDGEQADEEGEEDDGSPPAKKPRINCKGMAFVLTFVLYCIALLSASPQQQRYLQH